MYLLYIFPLSSTHLWLGCSNFFKPSKKNYFGCAANRKIGNRKSQKLISTPTYSCLFLARCLATVLHAIIFWIDYGRLRLVPCTSHFHFIRRHITDAGASVDWRQIQSADFVSTTEGFCSTFGKSILMWHARDTKRDGSYVTSQAEHVTHATVFQPRHWGHTARHVKIRIPNLLLNLSGY
jgi:hypothetical protein